MRKRIGTCLIPIDLRKDATVFSLSLPEGAKIISVALITENGNRFLSINYKANRNNSKAIFRTQNYIATSKAIEPSEKEKNTFLFNVPDSVGSPTEYKLFLTEKTGTP